jgi:hypothetical protein
MSTRVTASNTGPGAHGNVCDGPASATRHKGGHRVHPLSMSVVPQDSCRSCCVAETFQKVPRTECAGYTGKK